MKIIFLTDINKFSKKGVASFVETVVSMKVAINFTNLFLLRSFENKNIIFDRLYAMLNYAYKNSKHKSSSNYLSGALKEEEIE